MTANKTAIHTFKIQFLEMKKNLPEAFVLYSII